MRCIVGSRRRRRLGRANPRGPPSFAFRASGTRRSSRGRPRTHAFGRRRTARRLLAALSTALSSRLAAASPATRTRETASRSPAGRGGRKVGQRTARGYRSTQPTPEPTPPPTPRAPLSHAGSPSPKRSLGTAGGAESSLSPIDGQKSHCLRNGAEPFPGYRGEAPERNRLLPRPNWRHRETATPTTPSEPWHELLVYLQPHGGPQSAVGDAVDLAAVPSARPSAASSARVDLATSGGHGETRRPAFLRFSNGPFRHFSDLFGPFRTFPGISDAFRAIGPAREPLDRPTDARLRKRARARAPVAAGQTPTPFSRTDLQRPLQVAAG